jgi:hypothetical protein
MPRAPDKLQREFFDIVLAVLGIIQGLSLNQLAEKFARGENAIVNSDSILVYADFAFCFLILVRIFQTYLLAALDYSGWKASFYDIVSIFLVGILEYWIFESLEKSQIMNHNLLHFRAAVLLVIATLSHLIAFSRILWSTKTGIRGQTKRYHEAKLQVVNCMFSATGACICISSSILERTAHTAFFVSLFLCILVASNIAISVSMTFGTLSMPSKDSLPEETEK